MRWISGFFRYLVQDLSSCQRITQRNLDLPLVQQKISRKQDIWAPLFGTKVQPACNFGSLSAHQRNAILSMCLGSHLLKLFASWRLFFGASADNFGKQFGLWPDVVTLIVLGRMKYILNKSISSLKISGR